jgi:hypothetical protein
MRLPSVPLSVDITTGDDIFPPPIVHTFTRLLDGGTFTALSYPLELVAAEKLETILSRMTANTRARDYYDVYVLDHLDGEKLDGELLHGALVTTTTRRNTASILEKPDKAVAIITSDRELVRLWNSYVKKNSFAQKVDIRLPMAK